MGGVVGLGLDSPYEHVDEVKQSYVDILMLHAFCERVIKWRLRKDTRVTANQFGIMPRKQHWMDKKDLHCMTGASSSLNTEWAMMTFP